MKKIITLLTAFLFVFCAFGQDEDCKYAKNEVDPFTGKLVKQTKVKDFVVRFAEVYALDQYYELKNDSVFLNLMLYYSKDYKKFELSLNHHKAFIKMKDGSIVELQGLVKKDNVYIRGGFKPSYCIENIFYIDGATLKKFQTVDFESVRFCVYHVAKQEEMNIDLKPLSNQVKLFKTSSICIEK